MNETYDYAVSSKNNFCGEFKYGKMIYFNGHFGFLLFKSNFFQIFGKSVSSPDPRKNIRKIRIACLEVCGEKISNYQSVVPY